MTLFTFGLVLGDTQDKHGLRVLFTLRCYKDKKQISDTAIAEATVNQSSYLANESWVFAYDLCNEPDDVSAAHYLSSDRA